MIKIIEESWGWLGIKPDEIIGQNDFGNGDLAHQIAELPDGAKVEVKITA